MSTIVKRIPGKLSLLGMIGLLSALRRDHPASEIIWSMDAETDQTVIRIVLPFVLPLPAPRRRYSLRRA